LARLHEIRREVITRTILGGLGLGALYWVTASVADAYWLHGENLVDGLIRPGLYTLFMRLQVVFLLLFLSAYREILVQRTQQIARNWRGAEQACREVQSQNVRLLQELDSAHQIAQQALAADRAKSHFLAAVTHEIRTPLNGIMGMTEIALGTELTPEQRDFLETAKASADSLLRVINDVLDFSRMEAGKLDLEEVPFGLRDCLSDTVSALSLLASRKGLELTCEIAAETPDSLIGDPGRLRQIVVNLIGNAIKFTDRGHVRLGVNVEPRWDAETQEPKASNPGQVLLRFSVADTGAGIPREKQGAIFDAYARGGGAPGQEVHGSGLGLAISRQLAEMMGGRIWVESEPGEGSTFYFTARLGLPSGQESRSAIAPDAEPVDLKGLPVLVVDENATSRRILEETLSRWSMTPKVVEGGGSALEALEAAKRSGQAYMLVILDSKMGHMDGFALAERIKQNPHLASSSLIMLKGSGERGDAARCRQLGIAGYLTKPIRQAELHEAIVTVLGQDTVAGDGEVGDSLVTRHSLREARRRFHILLAEDDVVNRKFALQVLEQTGHTVVVAETGKEALAAFDRESFDLVLMDVNMPEQNGLDVTRTIRAREAGSSRHVPIIAMTARVSEEDRDRCLGAGMDGYLTKPITLKSIHEVLEEYLGPGTTARSALRRLASPDSAPADWGRIRKALEADPACERELLGLFVEQTRERLEHLDSAIRASNAERVSELAHGLKGASGNVEARRLEHLARRLESQSLAGELDAFPETFRRLKEEWERVHESLLDYLKSSRFAVAETTVGDHEDGK
jgi:signal transduction histidine kinase/DNA-binding response OmpR family regulator